MNEAKVAIKANRTTVSIIAPLSAGLDSFVSLAVEQGWAPLSVAMGFRTLALLFLLAIIPDDIYRRIGRRLSGRGSTDDINPPSSTNGGA